MHNFVHLLYRRSVARQTISIVTVAMYSALVFGFPLPAGPRKSSAVAGPGELYEG
jgi:hypothetical protein